MLSFWSSSTLRRMKATLGFKTSYPFVNCSLIRSFNKQSINQLIKQSNKFSTWSAYTYEHNIRIDNPEWGYLTTFYTGRLRPKVQP